MTVLLEPDVVDTDTGEPRMAHLVYILLDPYTGLCGAKLLGIPAHPDAPICEECEALA